MSAIKNLIKAHKAKAITQDTYTLIKFIAKHEETKGDRKGVARMELVAIETKYIPQFDKNSPQWNGQAGGNGHRTRFTLANGDTVGSFSQASHELYKFFAELMGHTGDESFLHIDIAGVIQVDVQSVALDNTRSTYEFSVIEEGSDLQGFSEYLPNAQEVLGLVNGTSLAIEQPKPQTESEEV
jgi:hypothetical protein